MDHMYMYYYYYYSLCFSYLNGREESHTQVLLLETIQPLFHTPDKEEQSIEYVVNIIIKPQMIMNI